MASNLLICGDGRFKAFRTLGHKEIPAMVVNVDDESAFIEAIGLIEPLSVGKTVDRLARETLEVLTFVGTDRHDERDHRRMELSPQAQWRYAQLYRGELNDNLGEGTVGALLERRAPMLLRLAMLLALTDLQTRIDALHIDAAMAWIRHATASVRHVFVSAAEDAKLAQVLELSNRVFAFLGARGQATRSQISADCFRGKVPKALLDASLEHLLAATPPNLTVS